MRILLFCPLAPTNPEIYPETWASIMALEWPEPLDIYMIRGDIDADSNHNRVLWKYRQARRRLLEGDYDALLTIEADMMVPADTISRLIALETDVAYGLYCWRHGTPWWNAYLDVSPISARSISEYPMLAERCWGRQVDVAGLGNGCTLIRRHVLEKLDFYRPYHACQDWGLSLDCQVNGFTQCMDLAVVCGHIADWPTKFIIWPSGESPFYRIETEDEDIMWKYASMGKYVPGIPTRDLSDDEWNALTDDQRRMAFGLYQYYDPEGAQEAIEKAEAEFNPPGEQVFAATRDVAGEE